MKVYRTIFNSKKNFNTKKYYFIDYKNDFSSGKYLFVVFITINYLIY